MVHSAYSANAPPTPLHYLTVANLLTAVLIVCGTRLAKAPPRGGRMGLLDSVLDSTFQE